MQLDIECKMLNKVTIMDKYPLPRMHDLFDQLRGVAVFSKIDLCLGYHQLRIREGDISNTTFKSRYGYYEFTIKSFDLIDAPVVFMDWTIQVFKEFLDTLVILRHISLLQVR